MNHPEQPNPAASEGYLEGGHGQFGEEFHDHVKESSARSEELDKYRPLAEAARNGGNEELANRLDAHIAQLTDENKKYSADAWVNEIWRRTQDLYRHEGGYQYLYDGFPGYPITDAVLPRVRRMLLGRDDLPGPPEQMQDGSTRYVVPMKAGTWYIEEYGHVSRDDDTEFVEVMLVKDQIT